PRRAVARGARALRTPGDGDQRVAGRGVDSGHSRGARGPKLGAPLLVDDRFVVTAALAEELCEHAQAPVLERSEAVQVERLHRLAHQLLGLVVATLLRADDAERKQRRAAGDAIL